MRRREFLGLVGGAAAWPVAARAQQRERLQRIGVLIAIAESDPEAQARVRAFGQALQELGWINGHNMHIEYRYAAGDPERARTYAAEFVSQGADAIVANSSLILSAVQRATQTIPVVFVQVADPVGGGFVESLARPGGHVTGFTSFEYSIGAKWLELLKEIAPNVRRVAVVRDPTFAAAAAQFGAIQTVAPTFRVQISPVGVRDAAEIERVINAITREPLVGMVVLPSPRSSIHRSLLVKLAAKHRLPTVYPYRYFAMGHGLISYGIDNIDLYRRAAGYVDRILKGEKPADLPVQAPTKYELVINLKTAKALGLTVPPTLLARANEVID
jgi:putative ABC transport system substrate-binding protein